MKQSNLFYRFKARLVRQHLLPVGRHLYLYVFMSSKTKLLKSADEKTKVKHKRPFFQVIL